MSDYIRYEMDTFPPKEELLRYGVDVPVPSSIDGLLCEYNEKEPTPLLQLHELDGYCVPPEGIIRVLVNGVGIRAGQGPMVYPAGTFRVDRHTIGKALGKTHQELTILRHEGRKNKVIDALAIFFEKKEMIDPALVTDKDPAVIAAMMVWAAEMVDDKQSPKEAVNLTKYLWDKVDNEQKILDKHTPEAGEVAVRALDTIDTLLAKLDKEAGEIIEGTVPFDVSGEE